MDLRLKNFYLESRINNASPGELLLMLYDALVENAEAAEAELAVRTEADRAQAARSVAKCIDIITELTAALRPEQDPALCETLRNLYCFFAREFSVALDRFDARKVTALLPLLRDLRGTWQQALKLANQAMPVPVAA